MDFEPMSIRGADAIAITGFADNRIRKLIRTGELRAGGVGRSVLIAYPHFKSLCEWHRQNEMGSQRAVNRHWPNLGRRAT